MRYVAWRLARAALTLTIVLLIAFTTLRYSGTPIQSLYPEGLTAEQEQRLLEKWNLHLPLHEQFLLYLQQIAKGDFGTSLATREPVVEVYLDRLPATLQLGGLAFVVAVAVGIPLGALSALERGTIAERAAMTLAFLGYAIPHFVIAILFILVFGFWLRWLPTTGLDTAWHYVLPVTTLALPMIAAIARFMRAAMLDAIGQDYVLTAQSKGLTDRLIARRHVLKNAMIPLVTVLGLEIAGLVNGSIIVEQIYAWPGVGKTLVGAVLQRDYPLLQFGVVAFAVVVVTINLIVDLLYVALDPRVRLDG